MKKLTTTFLIVLLLVGKIYSQAFREGNNAISVGYGFGTFIAALANDYENNNDYKFNGTGPVYAKFEYAIADKVGLGLNVAYANYKFSYKDSYSTGGGQGNLVSYKETVKYTTTSFLARVNFHFGDDDKFDPYYGIGLGFRTGDWTYESSDPNSPDDFNFSGNFPFGFETTVGARYFFNEDIGAYAEVGLAKSVGQLGLTFKF